MMLKVVRNAGGFALAFGPADDGYEPTVPDGCTVAVEEDPDLTPPPPTVQQQAEIKKKLLADAMGKRDVLLGHLRWFYAKALEEPAGAPKDAKVLAISNAITSLHNFFSDPRIVNAIDGAAKQAMQIVYLEIFQALYVASPATYVALKALDPL